MSPFGLFQRNFNVKSTSAFKAVGRAEAISQGHLPHYRPHTTFKLFLLTYQDIATFGIGLIIF